MAIKRGGASMGTFTKGEIVSYPFPYTNLKERKLRPCLVLSNEMGNGILLCQITSQKISRDNFCLELKSNETKNGSLKIDSNIRCNMLFTAEKFDIKEKICTIDKIKYNEVCEKINKIISII